MDYGCQSEDSIELVNRILPQILAQKARTNSSISLSGK